jgi:hypothetical protein
MFEVGRVYNRRLEIHNPYGGQRQGASPHPETGLSYSCSLGRVENSIATRTGGTTMARSTIRERDRMETRRLSGVTEPSETTPYSNEHKD